MALRFRAAKKSDLERLVEIHAAAFPDARGVEERKRALTNNPFGPLHDLVVVERDGELVGHAFLFRIEAWFGGRKVRVGAIASVGVAVEARGQGMGALLLGELHRRSRARGDAITMLYPFRHGYYARIGYGSGAPHKRLSWGPASIPAAWRLLAREHVVRADGRDREGMRRAYATVALHMSGWIHRSEACWERRLTRDHVTHLVVRGASRGAVRGYVAFAITRAKTQVRVLVEELVAVDDVARRALFGAIGALRDQASVVELEVSTDDPLEFALTCPDGRQGGTDVLGVVLSGPMVRMNDVTRAIEARGYARDGALDIVVKEGDALFAVCIDRGRARVRGAADRASAFSTSKATLASILYGGLRPSDALRLGLAEATPSVAARADELLAIPPLAPLDPF